MSIEIINASTAHTLIGKFIVYKGATQIAVIKKIVIEEISTRDEVIKVFSNFGSDIPESTIILHQYKYSLECEYLDGTPVEQKSGNYEIFTKDDEAYEYFTNKFKENNNGNS